jgi:serine/threonine-protein kinase
LGCMLFECLAGQPPFTNRNEAVVLQLHLSQTPPDVRSLRPETPADFASSISRALSKDREQRWPSAAAMREGLSGVPV